MPPILQMPLSPGMVLPLSSFASLLQLEAAIMTLKLRQGLQQTVEHAQTVHQFVGTLCRSPLGFLYGSWRCCGAPGCCSGPG